MTIQAQRLPIGLASLIVLLTFLLAAACGGSKSGDTSKRDQDATEAHVAKSYVCGS